MIVQWDASGKVVSKVTVIKDTLGRIYIPFEEAGKKKPQKVSFDGKKFSKVSSVEPRYQGEEVSHLCCTLEVRR